MQNETAELPIEGRYTLADQVTTYDLGAIQLYSALDRQLERQVAVQLLSASASAEDKARFLESQRIAAGIHHCGVLQVYDVGEWHGAHFSVVEKDAASRGGPTPAPDGESALSIARQVAEALQCVRDAGLTNWVFTPAALRPGADGAPRLALLEGFEHDPRYRSATSARPEDDGRALGALLGMFIAGLPLAAIPSGVHDLVERSIAGQDGAALTAGEFAAEIARIEYEAQQLTMMYEEARDAAVTPYMPVPEVDLHDAPTLAAPVMPVAVAAEAVPTQPYEGPAPARATQLTPESDRPRRRGMPLIPIAAAGLLLLLLLVFVAWPRPGEPTEVAGTAASAPEVTPTTAPASEDAAPTAAPTPAMLIVPEFLGKTLPEAKAVAQAAGLGLLVDSAVYSDLYPVDIVVSQDPTAGTPVVGGSEVVLVLSRGPEPPPPPPAVENDDDQEKQAEEARKKEEEKRKKAEEESKKDEEKKKDD